MEFLLVAHFRVEKTDKYLSRFFFLHILKNVFVQMHCNSYVECIKSSVAENYDDSPAREREIYRTNNEILCVLVLHRRHCQFHLFDGVLRTDTQGY